MIEQNLIQEQANQEENINKQNNQIQHFFQQFPEENIERSILSTYPQFKSIYLQSLRVLSDTTISKIQKWSFNREIKTYFYTIEPQKYLQFSKKERLKYLKENNETIMNYLIKAIKKREQNVQLDILNSVIKINERKIIKKNKDNQIQIPYQPVQDAQQMRFQAIKRHKQIIEKQKIQKKRLQEHKKKQQIYKDQMQLKKKQLQEKQKQEMRKHHSQIISQKIRKSLQMRQKQKQLRQGRDKQFKYLLKSFSKSLSLHEKMQKQFHQRYKQVFDQQRKKVQTQKSRLSHNMKIQDMNIKQHQQKYLIWKNQNQTVRAAKKQENQRINQMNQKQLQRRFKKRYSIRNNNQGQQDQNQSNTQSKLKYSTLNQRYKDIKQQNRKIAEEKRKKMEQYWQSFVKVNLKPKIDKKKQQQLVQLIQDLQNGKRMRKIKNQKGQVVVTEIKPIDHTIKGIQYLQHSRQMGRLQKLNRKKQNTNGQDDKKSNIISHSNLNKQQNKTIDYLKKLREQRSASTGNQTPSLSNRLSFIEKRQIPFIQKLQRIQRETFKLKQSTEFSQEQLKYGKFKSTEQILNHTQSIDNNHIQILKMKLKLISNQ